MHQFVVITVQADPQMNPGPTLLFSRTFSSPLKMATAKIFTLICCALAILWCHGQQMHSLTLETEPLAA